ncbi:fluoride efflux transporter CrcB [Phytoactinopolyspora halotolerans]|uniref:Fluoride-specific ion channel FluC n=1 Tax=Phytoactinopolyspora halotolerans TaxID=1981512 RepID=A0A6L9SAS6_9ACTN|nr:fluoride efflux transporter CrcB [Phytoactinopolyspora halotolerans]NEE01724.1 fluoride efflux transporter CrcB [Phytoactinopolyspora halotolerans]
MTVLLVALGAAVGAPLRYLADRFIQSRIDAVFPWGTLAVNVVGSFVLGVVMALSADGGLGDDTVALVGVGFCGALTTYSTFSYETLRLLEDGARWYALGNVAGSVIAGVAAAAAGWALAS